tara:strand:- start:34161 stop:34907 length:747 start_codon:yes stop_codon:yes gene_type:complete
MKNRSVAIIPSRLESSRLPNKALKLIEGIPLVIHVLKRCQLSECLEEVYVATDSKEIADIVKTWGGEVIMTSKDHKTGTDRIAEACKEIEAEIILNVQGDEALVNPKHIDTLCKVMESDDSILISILVNKFHKKNSPSDIKVVLNEMNEVMYFSREDIPSYSRNSGHQMLKAYHIVPFRKEFLLKYASWEPTELEKIEFNEYVRVLEKGYKIKAIEVESSAVSVDTEEDLAVVSKLIKKDPFLELYKN